MRKTIDNAVFSNLTKAYIVISSERIPDNASLESSVSDVSRSKPSLSQLSAKLSTFNSALAGKNSLDRGIILFVKPLQAISESDDEDTQNQIGGIDIRRVLS